MSNYILQVEDLRFYYGESQILESVSLRVSSGECVVMLERNGMGKTTLLRSIMNLTPPRKDGDIYFHDHKITTEPSANIATEGIGYAPQGRRLFKSLTVQEHLELIQQSPKQGKSKWDPEQVYDLFPV